MAENVMDQVVSELRRSGANWYPERTELRNVRVVGHTPKTDHYIYDIVIDFADGSERLAAKVYRSPKSASNGPRTLASAETRNLQSIYELATAKNLGGIPRPVGDFSELGVVVSEKVSGIPLQSIIMKAALLPGYADRGLLQHASKVAGEWLREFQKATVQEPIPLEGDKLLAEMEKLCQSCKGEGLDDASISKILSGAKAVIARNDKPHPSCTVLNDFCPLNVMVVEQGIGFCDFAKTAERGSIYTDAATFLAAVEALEKYPFCNRTITTEVQENFLEAYGANEDERDILRVVKMKVLLSMFAAGRTVKESAVRKKVMWANVMKKFIQQAADRSLAPAA